MINFPFDFSRGMDILLTILTISIALCFIRLLLGPSIPNRIIAFDSIAIHAVAILALYATRIGAQSILDAALVVAVLGFLGTTMMAKYLERSAPIYYALTRNKDGEPTELARKIAPIERRKNDSAKNPTGSSTGGSA